jgi:2-polyprenyl-3-methyl-5-hydroxy-6-metoxy-1,4-benzoquinol methylase
MYEGEIETLPIALGSLDFITAFDVIEHHPSPSHLLREMHRLLRPGGLVAISTHDIGNPFARRYGAHWRFINPIGHLTYFSRQTLEAMLSRNGFQVLYRGGIHTADGSRAAEIGNWVIQFLRVIVLRTLVISLYLPLSKRFPSLTRWRIESGQGEWDHRKLQIRAGQQIIMNDDMVFIARRGYE